MKIFRAIFTTFSPPTNGTRQIYSPPQANNMLTYIFNTLRAEKETRPEASYKKTLRSLGINEALAQNFPCCCR